MLAAGLGIGMGMRVWKWLLLAGVGAMVTISNAHTLETCGQVSIFALLQLVDGSWVQGLVVLMVVSFAKGMRRGVALTLGVNLQVEGDELLCFVVRFYVLSFV